MIKNVMYGSSPLYKAVRALFALALIALGIWLLYGRFSTKSSLVINMDKLHGKTNIIPVAIIGSGPAGLSAALYTSRAHVYTVVFEGKHPGGQLMTTTDVENWPGIGKHLGPDIMKGLKTQVAKFDTNLSNASIERVDFSQWPFILWTDDGTQIHAMTVIIATGANPRKLGIPGEQEYWGRSVTACATCDAPFFKDKEVVVVGGGDTAAEQAIQLAAHARKITILVRGSKMRAAASMQERLKAYPHISIKYNTKVLAIVGNGTTVTNVTLEVDGKEASMPIDGVFLAIGHDPNTELFANILARDNQNYLLLPEAHKQVTSIPGVFAAGDVADHVYRQAGVAAGDGIKAGLDALNFLGIHGFNDIIATRIEPSLFMPAHDVVKKISDIKNVKQFEQLVLRAKKPVVVDFYTPYCPSCMQMMPALSAVAASLDKRVEVYKVDGAQLPELMQRFSVPSVPCFLVFKDGMVIGRSTASMTKRELRAFIEKFA